MFVCLFSFLFVWFSFVLLNQIEEEKAKQTDRTNAERAQSARSTQCVVVSALPRGRTVTVKTSAGRVLGVGLVGRSTQFTDTRPSNAVPPTLSAIGP